MDAPKDPTRPSMMQKTPPKVCTTHKAHNLPLIPNLFPTASEIIPPPGRETMFARPKLAAIIPAVWSLSRLKFPSGKSLPKIKTANADSV
ncbi:hypothetical protein NC652_035074 [Populus alba x Populus x berolinensis]|nr:hypothetical protein NC652_035074 [Populus alba x Populus x berolinensis]